VGDGLVGHEPTPNISGKQILRAQQRDALIDTHNVAVEPLQGWIIGIDESVAAIDALSELASNGAQGWNGDVGREHQRTPGGRRRNRSIHGFKAFDLSVNAITFRAIRCGNAPDVGAKRGWNTARDIQAVGAVDARCVD